MKCKLCEDTNIVCEDHPDKAWKSGEGCCGGAGMFCICHPDYYKDRGIEKNERS